MPTINANRTGWIRFMPGFTVTSGAFSFTMPDQYDVNPSSAADRNVIGSTIGAEIRAYWLWNLSSLAGTSYTSAKFGLVLETSGTLNVSSGHRFNLKDATPSYDSLLAYTANSASFATSGPASFDAVYGDGPVTAPKNYSSNSTPTLTYINIGSETLTTINAAIAGTGKFALGGYMQSVDLTIVQLAMKGTPSLTAVLVLS